MAREENPDKNKLGRWLLESYTGSTDLGRLHLALQNQLIELRNAVARQDWSKVQEVGARCMGFGHACSRVLQTEQASFNLKFQAGITNVKSLTETLIGVAESDIREEVVQGIREEIRAERPDIEEKIDEQLRKLEQGDPEGASFLESIIDLNQLTKAPEIFNLVRKAAIACLSRGLLALVHQNFNQAYLAYQWEIIQFLEIDFTDALEDLIESFTNDLRALEVDLKMVLTKKLEPQEVIRTGDHLSSFVEQRLPALARAQAFVHLAAQALMEQGKGGEAEKIGKLAMQAGLLTREALSSYVAANRISVNILATEIEEEVLEVISSAASLEFEARIPNGKNVEISKLNEVEDGEFIEIMGFVMSLETEIRGDDILVSRMELQDPSSDAIACAGIIFTHLAHAGITPGSFCRVNGVLQTESSLCQGTRGIVIDRLSLVELAKESWLVAFLRLSNRWYENWRNNINLYWSLGPYKIVLDEDEVNEAASSFGAGELIFLPFIRTK